MLRITSIAAFVLLLSTTLTGAEGEAISFPAKIERYGIWQCRFSPADFPVAKVSNHLLNIVFKIDMVSPSGKIFRLHPFVNRDYVRSRDVKGRGVLQASGNPFWSVRFSPEEIGVYKCKVAWRHGGKVIVSFEFESVVGGQSEGFLRRKGGSMVFDSGRRFFAIGHNVCWVGRDKGTFEYERYFKRMADNGENYTRIWLCTWGLNIDTNKPYVPSLAGAWRLDYVLKEAARRGIYVMLCIDNFYDFRNHRDKSPFSVSNGGSCVGLSDFFISDKAREQYRARMQYLISRYSSYRNLLAWELWNEMDYTITPGDVAAQKLGGDAIRDNILLPWSVKTAGWIKKNDPHRHMVTTSLGMHAVWPKLWHDESIDIVQYHSYIHYIDIMRGAGERDAAAFLLAGQKRVSGFGKPFFVSEFGYMGPDDKSEMNMDDPEGIALHNSIWAAAVGGADGTPMQWWWDNYIDPKNIYYHYKPLAEFLTGSSLIGSGKPMRIEDKDLRVLALRGEREALFWLQNRENTWHNRIRNKVKPRELQGIVLKLSGFCKGIYQLEWFGTYSGKIIRTDEVDGREGIFRLKPPPFKLDIAARMRLK